MAKLGDMRETGDCVKAFLLAWLVAGVAAQAVDNLSVQQLEEIRRGQQLVLSEEVPGNAWPKVTVYQWSSAAPEEMAAVFFDYESARTFVPNVLKSAVSKRYSSCEMDVDYTLQIPVLPNEEYRARNTLRQVPGGGYSIRWKLLVARHTKASVGEFLVRPSGGGSIARYEALTTPTSAIAGLLRGRAVAQMKAALAAICREVERQRQVAPEELSQRVHRLRQALDPEATFE